MRQIIFIDGTKIIGDKRYGIPRVLEKNLNDFFKEKSGMILQTHFVDTGAFVEYEEQKIEKVKHLTDLQKERIKLLINHQLSLSGTAEDKNGWSKVFEAINEL
jgi:hypothetical protein